MTPRIDVAILQRAAGVALVVVPIGLVTAAGPAWRTFMSWLFDHYKPENHYMRGPGPKWHEKRRLRMMRVEDGRRHG
jgi:hypothetical protein